MTGRPIPHDLDAEEALLGACMLSPAAVEAAINAGVTAPDFYKPAHADYFRAIVALPYAPDPVSVAGALNGHGGPNALTELRRIQAATPASANAPAYAHAVRDTARRRQLLLIAHELDVIAREGGDAAATLERAREIGLPATTVGDLVSVDWADAFTRRENHADWLVEPLIPLGAQILFYAPKKTGKSLLNLEIAAGLATGRPILDQAAGPPKPVLVVDFENTVEEDIVPRLEDLGYRPDDLANLHYYSFPPIRPLDTAEGARRLDELIVRHRPALVILDSFQRIVEGPENDADTVRAYYQHTGFVLKRHKVTSIRLDNSGKDETAGARGSSAKGDDVDLIWRLRRMENGYRVTRDAQRGTLAPEQINLQRIEVPYLHHKVTVESWPEGTAKLVDTLDRLRIPTTASVREVKASLRSAGESAGSDVLSKAVKYRRIRTPGEARNANGTDDPSAQEITPGTSRDTSTDQGGTPDGTRRNAETGKDGTAGGSLDPAFQPDPHEGDIF